MKSDIDAQSKETISVVITSYNQVDYLKEAINSVLYQTYPAYEIIICDDASHDNSCDLIREYEKRFPDIVKGIFHKKNLGISKNRNSGLMSVKGRYATWLDGDDIFRPKKLELELHKITCASDIKWVYSQVIHVDLESYTCSPRYKQFYDGWIFNKIVSQLGSAPRNPLVEYNALKSIGFFDETMEMYEDYDLCLRLSYHFKCLYCAHPLMEYQIHSGGTHKSITQKHINNYNILRKNLRSLLQGLTEKEKREYEMQFLFCPNSLLLHSKYDLETGRRRQLIRRAFFCFFLFPRYFIKSHLYGYLIKAFLPKASISYLENRKVRKQNA